MLWLDKSKQTLGVMPFYAILILVKCRVYITQLGKNAGGLCFSSMYKQACCNLESLFPLYIAYPSLQHDFSFELCL